MSGTAQSHFRTGPSSIQSSRTHLDALAIASTGQQSSHSLCSHAMSKLIASTVHNENCVTVSAEIMQVSKCVALRMTQAKYNYTTVHMATTAQALCANVM